MHIWIESAVKRLLNTKMPTEDVVGLPAQSQVGGACVLPPIGMALNQKGFCTFCFLLFHRLAGSCLSRRKHCLDLESTGSFQTNSSSWPRFLSFCQENNSPGVPDRSLL